MPGQYFVRASIIRGLPGIRCGNVGHAFMRVIDSITSRTQDIGNEEIRLIESTGRIVNKYDLALRPFCPEPLAVRHAERAYVQIVHTLFTPSQLRFSLPSIAEIGYGPVVFSPKAMAQVVGAALLIYSPTGYCDHCQDGDNYRQNLPELHTLSPGIPFVIQAADRLPKLSLASKLHSSYMLNPGQR
jgi:hypothetical protein